MVVDGLSVVLNLGRGKQWRLRYTRGRDIFSRIENGVLDGLARWRPRGIGADVRRDRWRHGQRLLAVAAKGRGRRFEAIGMTLGEAINDRVGR
jgi:hypothetical protein